MDRVRQAIALDCERLVETFASNDSHEFAVFCKVWKSALFQHMYSALLRDVEIVQMTESIFEVISKIMFDNESLRKRKEKFIGCLYTVYAVYFKQPTERYVKFKITQPNWNTLKTFVESLAHDPTTIQARYIFYKLITVNAFIFVFATQEFGCEDAFNKTVLRQHRKHRPVWLSVQTDVNELNHSRSGLIESLNILEGGYNEMKTILNSQAQRAGNSSHQKLATSNFMSEVKDSFQSIADLLSSNFNTDELNSSKENVVEEDDPARAVQKEPIEERRKRIRRKAYEKNKSVLVQDAYDVSLNGDIIQIASVQKVRKADQTVKTLLQQDLPEDIKKELYQ